MMIKIQKSLTVILMGVVYLIGTSIFSHLAVIGDHHTNETGKYQHTDGSIHEHKEIASCNSKDCQKSCYDIEKGKIMNVVSLLSYMDISNRIVHVIPAFLYQSYSTKLLHNKVISKTGPPNIYKNFLSYSNLVGIVRIIG